MMGGGRWRAAGDGGRRAAGDGGRWAMAGDGRRAAGERWHHGDGVGTGGGSRCTGCGCGCGCGCGQAYGVVRSSAKTNSTWLASSRSTSVPSPCATTSFAPSAPSTRPCCCRRLARRGSGLQERGLSTRGRRAQRADRHLLAELVLGRVGNPDRRVQARRRAATRRAGRPRGARRALAKLREAIPSETADSELQVAQLDCDESDRDTEEWTAGFDSASAFVGLFLAEHSIAPEPGRRACTGFTRSATWCARPARGSRGRLPLAPDGGAAARRDARGLPREVGRRAGPRSAAARLNGRLPRARILLLAAKALGFDLLDTVPDQSSRGKYRAAVTHLDVSTNVLRGRRLGQPVHLPVHDLPRRGGLHGLLSLSNAADGMLLCFRRAANALLAAQRRVMHAAVCVDADCERQGGAAGGGASAQGSRRGAPRRVRRRGRIRTARLCGRRLRGKTAPLERHGGAPAEPGLRTAGAVEHARPQLLESVRARAGDCAVPAGAAAAIRRLRRGHRPEQAARARRSLMQQQTAR